MNQIKSKKDAEKTPLKFHLWSWAWPIVIITLVLSKSLGVVTGLIALGVYFWLKEKVIIWQAVLASAVLALVVGVVFVSYINDI